ncbi:MAG: hypothetical protein AAF196_00980 [Planctomycetota bacterium]
MPQPTFAIDVGARRLRSLLHLLPCLVVLGLTGALQAQLSDPTFEEGDPIRLRCRVVGMEKADFFTRVLVEVKNGTDHHADPLRFVVRAAGRRRGDSGLNEDVFERARLPHAGRFSAGIAPGRSARYWIQTAVPTGKKPRVSVDQANFHSGYELPEGAAVPTAEELDESRGSNPQMGRDFKIATFSINNPFERMTDVWVLAEYTRPSKESALLGYRLRPGETRQVSLGHRAWQSGWDDSEGIYSANIELRSVEVVDWVQFAEIDHEDAKQTFLGIYRDWSIFPSNIREVRATFTSFERGTDSLNGKDMLLRVQGTLRISSDRRVSVELDERSEAAFKRLTRDGTGFLHASDGFLQGQALRFLCRRPPEAYDQQGEIRWLSPNSVQIISPNMNMNSANGVSEVAGGYSNSGMRLVFEEGRFVADSFGMRTENEWTWKSEKLGKQWVIAERHQHPAHSTIATTESWDHGREAGLPVLNEYRYLQMSGDEVRSSQVLTFDDWEFEFREGTGQDVDDETDKKPAPTGAGAKALAEAWSQIHQFPQVEDRWSGEAFIVTNGTDGVWQGMDRFRATVHLNGFRHHDTRIRLDTKGRASADKEAALGGVFTDRLGMWYGSDPQSMGHFEQAFAGYEIEKVNSQGWHRLSGGPIQRVRVQKGLVREIVGLAGRHIRVHYEDFEGIAIITRIERGLGSGAEVRIEPTRLGEWIVPTRFEFREIFGEDWGPEVFELTGLRLDS